MDSKTVIAAENENLKGWNWIIYDDGSGSLRSPEGKRYYPFDQQTGQMVGLNSRYEHMESRIQNPEYREKLEKQLAGFLAEREKIRSTVSEKTVVLFGPGDRRSFRMPMPGEICALDREVRMDGKTFSEWYQKAREAEERWFADGITYPNEFAQKIAWAVKQEAETFSFEDVIFDLKSAAAAGVLAASGDESLIRQNTSGQTFIVNTSPEAVRKNSGAEKNPGKLMRSILEKLQIRSEKNVSDHAEKKPEKNEISR